MANTKRLRKPEDFDTWIKENAELFHAVQVAGATFCKLVLLLPQEMRALLFAVPVAIQMHEIGKPAEVATFLNNMTSMAWSHVADLEGDDTPQSNDTVPPGEPVH